MKVYAYEFPYAVSDRDEEAMPLGQPRRDGVYFHMQDQAWKIQFNGSDRFETFPIEQYDAANLLFVKLMQGGDLDE